MGKLKVALLSLVLCLAVAFPQKSHALDARIKTMGVMALYGTVGGGLLGTAALAFDAPGRSPFIGMSLGLYAGLLFGSYILVTHAMKKYKEANPDEGYYPEVPNETYEGFEELTYPPADDMQQQRWGNYWEMEKSSLSKKNSWTLELNRARSAPSFYFNVLNVSF